MSRTRRTFTTPTGAKVSTQTTRSHVLIGEQEGGKIGIERRSDSTVTLKTIRRGKDYHADLRW
jgi:hypothetical protein